MTTERIPCVIYATLPESGDMTDVLAVGQTNAALLVAQTVQEAHNLACIAHVAAIQCRVPFIVVLPREQGQTKINSITHRGLEALVKANHHHYQAFADNQHPEKLGSDDVASVLEQVGKELNINYRPFRFVGPLDARRVFVAIGPIAHVIEGNLPPSSALINVTLYRPWMAEAILEALPAIVERVAVVSQSHAGGHWSPLYLDLVTALHGTHSETHFIDVQAQSLDITTQSLQHVLSTMEETFKTGGVETSQEREVGISETAPEYHYIKMLQQVFKDRLIVANAARYQSVWGPTTSTGADQTAEFGLGVLLEAINKREQLANKVKSRLSSLNGDWKRVLETWVSNLDDTIIANKTAAQIEQLLEVEKGEVADLIRENVKLLSKPSRWLLGGSEWAYDLGNSGVHHVISTKADIKMLILDTLAYSTNKTETHRPEVRKKDIGLYAMTYGGVYVASCALHSSYGQLLQSLVEADAYRGPAVVLAYAPKVGKTSPALLALKETKMAVDTGYWPLYRFDPTLEKPFTLESEKLKKELSDFLERSNMLSMLVKTEANIAPEFASSVEKELETAYRLKAAETYQTLLGNLSSEPLLILYGSDGGNAASVAKKLAQQAKSLHFTVRIMAADEYVFEDIVDEKHVAFIVSTAGQGEFPMNVREFWKFVNGNELDLHKVKYSVFAMGDRHYWPLPEDAHYFAKAGKDLFARLKKMGGQILTEMGIGDDQDSDGWMTGYQKWMPEFWNALGVEAGFSVETSAAADDSIKIASNFLRGTIAEGLVDEKTGSLKEFDQKLTKFHGIYQQDDRDIREERRIAGEEPAYSFMVRVRLPGGVATPHQWLAMDEIARKRGNDTMKITTRQTFQLHGIVKHNLKTAIQEMNQALMDTIAACGDVNRNVMMGTLPHLSHIHREVYEFGKAWSEHMLPATSAYHEIWLDKKVVLSTEEKEPIYGPTYLPRKFKTVVAIPPSNDVDIFAHDLGFIAIVEDGKLVGYNVTIGGGMGMTHGNKKTYPRMASVLGFVEKEKALDVGEKVLTVQRDYGDRTNRKHARMKYTVDDYGVEWYKTEVESRIGYKLLPAKPFEFTHNTDKYGWIQGDDEMWHYTLFCGNGRIKDTPERQLKTGLREIAGVLKGEFRLTANQHLTLSNISTAEKPKIEALLRKYDIHTDYSGMRLSSMACVALPTCALAMAESERYLPSLLSRLETYLETLGLRDDEIVIRMTGCPNGCARPYNAEIAFVGKAPGSYNLYLGGSRTGDRLAKLYKESIGEEEIVSCLSLLFEGYVKGRDVGESFGDWVIRAGVVKRVVVAKTDFHD